MTRVTLFRILLAFASATLTVLALGQVAPMKPGTPVVRFRLPLFNEQGHRTWFMRGERGIYESESQIRIEEMRLSQYSGDVEDRRIAVLTSDEAIFHLNTNTAYGPGELAIESDNFTARGEDWIWQGDEKQITLNRDVRVVIQAQIGDIIR